MKTAKLFIIRKSEESCISRGITEISTIDESSFDFDNSCPNLEEVIFPEGLKTIGDMHFKTVGS